MDGSGVKADPDKIWAIQGMKAPSTITELRHFLGIINQLSKFSPQLADKTKSLRDIATHLQKSVDVGSETGKSGDQRSHRAKKLKPL